jgi:uncharacterized protein (DUF2336 family)
MSSIVERFLSWAGRAPAHRRQKAAHMLARAFLISPLEPDERDQIETAMTVLLDDPALDVRLTLAKALAASDAAPHHIILSLAADKTPVAAAVIEQSPVILDSELVDLIATREEVIQVAVARRPFLSRAVSAALAEVGSTEACLALVKNPGARLLRFSLDRIVERHGDHPGLRLALLEQEDLPVEVRHSLVGKHAEAVGRLITGRAWLDPDRAQALLKDSRELATIVVSFDAPAASMPALVQQLIAAKELTPAFLVRAVAAGQARLFEAGLAALSHVPAERVRSLVASGRNGNLRALLRAAGLPAWTHPVFAAAIDVIRKGDSLAGATNDYRRATHLIDTIVKHYERRPDRELDHILALLRRFATEAKRSAARQYAEQIREAA